MADLRDLSEEETALIVAMQGGSEPRADDPLVKALEARGVVRGGQAGSQTWRLTAAGTAYRPDQD